MGCNESFTTNTGAITKDSEPRVLRFVGISQLSRDLVGEGKVIRNYGTTVTLDHATKPGQGITPAVPAPLLSQLTDGGTGPTRNKIDVVMSPRVINDRLEAGSGGGFVSVTFNTQADPPTDPSVPIGPFDVSVNDLVDFADALGDGAQSNVFLPSDTASPPGWSPRFPWNISALVGKTILSVDYNVLRAFAVQADAPVPLLTTQQLKIIVGIDPASFIYIPIASTGTGTVSLGAGIVADRPQFILTPSSLDNVEAWAPNSEVPIVFTVVFDATTLLALPAAAPFLAASSGAFPISNLEVYAGYVILNSTAFTVNIPYGPLPLFSGTNILEVRVIDYPVFSDSWTDIAGTLNESGLTNDLPAFVPPGSGNSNVTLRFEFDSYQPDETADPILMTEAYEVRQRNILAFRFHSSGATGDEEVQLKAQMYVSQGSPTDSNGDRLWTAVPVDLIQGSFSAKEQVPATFPSILGIDVSMPPNYGGPLLIVSKEYKGPYNYVRFLIWVESTDGLSGVSIQATANAREL